MVDDLVGTFVGCFLLPLPFFFVAYVVRQVKKYFEDATGINVKD